MDHLKICLVKDDWTPKDVAKYAVQNFVEESTDSNKTFIIFNVKDMIDQVNKWKEWMPRAKPYYAVKSNNSTIVLEILARLGFNFDCASYQEIKQVLSLGVDPDRIVFAHTTKPDSAIRYAKDHNVDLLSFDTDIELFKIKQHHPNARLLLRIKSDAKSALGVLGNKFGCCAQTEGPTYLKIAKDLDLNVVGICYHVGSLCFETEAYINGMRMAKDLMEIGATLGFDMKIVDIGGGFLGGQDSDLKIIFKKLSAAMDEYFPPEGSVEIIAEPGRYFVSSAFTLACQVHSAKRPLHVINYNDTNNGCVEENHPMNGHDDIEESTECNEETLFVKETSIILTKDSTEVGCDEMYSKIEEFKNETAIEQKMNTMYFLDNGIYGSFGALLWKRLTLLPEPLEPLTGPEIECSLWGPTCDGKDMICSKVYLPPLPIPSWLLFPNFGAYTCTTSTNFNGFSKPIQYTFIPKSLENFMGDLFHKKPEKTISWIDTEKVLWKNTNNKIQIPTNISFEDIAHGFFK